MIGHRVAAACCLLLVVASGASLKVNNKWQSGLCGAFDLKVNCPASCSSGCELDITDASLVRSTFQVREDGDIIGQTPTYTNPLQPATRGVDARRDFPAFSEDAEQFSSASFILSEGDHEIEVVGSALLKSKDMSLLETPEIASRAACAYVRASCYTSEELEPEPEATPEEEVKLALNIPGASEGMSLLPSRRGLYVPLLPGVCLTSSPVALKGTQLAKNTAKNTTICCNRCRGYLHGPRCHGYTFDKMTQICYLLTDLTSFSPGGKRYDSALVVATSAVTGLPIYPTIEFGNRVSTPKPGYRLGSSKYLIAPGKDCKQNKLVNGCATNVSGCRFGALGYIHGPKAGAWQFNNQTYQCAIFAPGQQGKFIKDSKYTSGIVTFNTPK